ncbi:MAG TPA: FxSxx-COOH system tetratricopeptide repeat protein [Ktedonobacteraceae bacterium]|jgi:tetratricopeptide (TPR) repeat protein/transcriptional regulator with XRE-family HTH domain
MANGSEGSLGKRLRVERERLHWTQKQLAGHLGSSVPSVNRWEQDKAIPRPDMFHRLIELFGRPPERWGTPGQPRWQLPFLRNPYFTGREPLLRRLHQILAAHNTGVCSQIRALSGLGGIGKTQIAIEYSYRYGSEYEAVLWVQADSRETLLADIAGLAFALDLPEQEEREQFRVVAAVKRWLQTHTSWLLIVDNAEERAAVLDVLPRQSGGAVLVTTRSQTDWPQIKKLEVETMSQHEGVSLLLRRSACAPDDEDQVPVAKDQQAAQELWVRMGGLPLALDQAGAYIQTCRCSLADYLELYRYHRRVLLQRRGAESPEHPDAVTATWALSFQRVAQQDAGAAELLRLCAFLSPDAIPEELLSGGAAYFPPALRQLATSPLLLNEAIGVLRTYALIQRDPQTRLLSLHQLVQAVVQDELDEAAKQRWAQRAMLAVNAVFARVEHGLWPQRERLLPHALLAIHFIEVYRLDGEQAGRLLHEMACYLQSRARSGAAEPLFQRALQIRERRAEVSPLDLATSLNGLANFYCEQGKYALAQSFSLRALRLRKRSLGPEHVDVAVSLHELANLQRLLGRYVRAEVLFERALRIREQHLGADHPLVAFSLAGLATLYWDTGRYPQAERLFLQALERRERQVGAQHPDVAYALNNLAGVYVEQGRYSQAAHLYQRVLRIREEHLGPEHPDVAHPLNNLAEVLFEQGAYAEAEPLYRRALRLWTEHLGEEHPQVAHPLYGLAQLARVRGAEEEAEKLYCQALCLREEHLGPAHPAVAYPLHGLAYLFWQQGKYEQAEVFFQRVLHIRSQALGWQHPQVAGAVQSLALFYAGQGRDAEAEHLYRRALAIWERSLDLDHAQVSYPQPRSGRSLS